MIRFAFVVSATVLLRASTPVVAAAAVPASSAASWAPPASASDEDVWEDDLGWEGEAEPAPGTREAWEEWRERNAAAIVATDVMVGKTRRVTKSGIGDAHNQIAGFLIVEAADIAAAAGLFQVHPHITVFPGDGIDVMPVVTGPPEDQSP